MSELYTDGDEIYILKGVNERFIRFESRDFFEMKLKIKNRIRAIDYLLENYLYIGDL